MLLFRDQFKLSKPQLNGLRDVCVFIVRLYVKVWFGCTEAVEAPNQDLHFLKSLHEYTELDENLSNTMVKKFIRHLWYLAEEAVALAFFDSNVSYDTKRKMVTKMRDGGGDKVPEGIEEELHIETEEEMQVETEEADTSSAEGTEVKVKKKTTTRKMFNKKMEVLSVTTTKLT